ncbi:hypothetical protein [Micromonospora sp. 15K316]|uniref:hypothetical protein n=1 Tax=Micromonospora sp. 15K316 TaxID=2530376 RepID=UPI00140527B1|nr:hypothetical protein [Micromonospora sp. 15K316]
MPAGMPHHSRIAQDPWHVHTYDLVDDGYPPVVDAAEELIVEKPFDTRPSLRDVAP